MSIRIGKVSSIDYDAGEIDVLYEDRDDQVASGLSFVCNGEYRFPQIGDPVAVAHLSNGEEVGIVLGTYTVDDIPQQKRKKGLFYKLISKVKSAYIAHDDSSGILTIHADHLEFSCTDGQITLQELLQRLESIEQRLEAGE